ncbi:Rv1733c family protein [Prauserella muralis]|uniref:Uncharacterized protein n=1 Tax=Prauserella muralis TaxID=588067 RepID=A0A2V4B2I2_9PSEU|nr:hypothetical protein [Prauserella muralis]PXY28263.1 hypothetical protein BAY60_18285 [Prauserella muralis]TWE27437.1 hypothetical protein FHX69_0067 [Prauserella muralis]
MPASPTYLLRLWRRVRIGSNPLARCWDRIEAAALLGVVLLSLFAVPVTAALGSETYAENIKVSRDEMRDRRQTTAVLLADAPRENLGEPGVSGGGSARVWAQWVLQDGTKRTGNVVAKIGANAGSAMSIWVDERGDLAVAPTTTRDAVGRAVSAALLAWLAVAGGLSAVFWLLRKGLDQLRYAQWTREWEHIGRDPSWS